MIKFLRSEVTSVGDLVKPLCSYRPTQSQLHRAVPRWLLNIAKGRDSQPLWAPV